MEMRFSIVRTDVAVQAAQLGSWYWKPVGVNRFIERGATGAGGGIELPFGGMKKSGHGREKGFEAMYEFAALKTIVMRHG
jgi:acyl-CoA reductase-like NAD-dependent aldehyde dehydrogenase